MELLVRPATQRTTLGHALNLLAGAALRYRDRFGIVVPAWALIGSLGRTGQYARFVCFISLDLWYDVVRDGS